MSTESMVRIGTAAAQAAIDQAAKAGDDRDVAALRTELLDFLHVHASQVSTAENAELLSAYRGWLDVAVQLYGTADTSRIREYVHRSATLSAELGLAAAGIDGAVQPHEERNSNGR